MNYNIYPPSGELSSIVKQYSVFTSLENINSTLFLPNGCNFLIFNRGCAINSKFVDSDEIYEVPKGYSLSIKRNKVKQFLLDSNDCLEFPIIVAELLPLGIYKLFDIDLSSVDDMYLSLEEELVEKFFSKVYTFENIEDELNYLDSSLVKLKNYHGNLESPIESIVYKIYNDYNHDMSVEDIIKVAGFSRSTLERYFKKFTGLTPKNFIYIIKFSNTILNYVNEKKTLSDLPYLYSDNSHMNVVFHNFLGISPREVLKKTIDGEFSIYELLNIHKDQLGINKGSIVLDIQEILKYSQNLKVLYVEDEEMLRSTMTTVFKNYFNHVDIAVDGMDGFNKYQEMHEKGQTYDLVLTDINMPKVNGIDMSREILKLVPTQQIVIISAHCEYITTAKEMGIKHIMTKPVNFDSLSNSIYEVSKEISGVS